MDILKSSVEEAARKSNLEGILPEVMTRANSPEERFMAVCFYKILGLINDYLAKVDYLTKPIRIAGELNLRDADPLSINGYKLKKRG